MPTSGELHGLKLPLTPYPLCLLLALPCCCAGTAPEQQRLIYSGQILYFPHRSMQQLRIGEGHSLQLAVRDSSAGSGSGNGSSGGGSAAAAAPAAATGGAVGGDREASQRAKELGRAAEHSYLGAGDVLVVSSVAELQEQVAAGAALLALYVEALQPKQQ